MDPKFKRGRPQGQYRTVDFVSAALGKNKRWVRSRYSSEGSILSAAEVDMLFACQKFDTIEGHTQRLGRRYREQLLNRSPSSLRERIFAGLLRIAQSNSIELPFQENEIGPIRAQLQAFIEKGLLASEEAIRSEVMELCRRSTEDHGLLRITAIGIPTRNRTDCLRRGLESCIANFKRHRRRPLILVVDDSSKEHIQEKNQKVLSDAGLRHRGEIRYIGLPERREIASRIAKYADVAEEVVRFALLGDDRCPQTYGATRNVLLLASVGGAMVQLDDDMICNITRPPETELGLSLASDDINEVWWYRSREEALNAVPFESHDLLGLHEKLLGKMVGTCVQEYVEHESVDVAKTSSRFLRNLEVSEARVVTSMLGTVGDSGMQRNNNMLRLLTEGDNWERLVFPESEYRVRLNTRQLIRAPRQFTVTDSAFCMSGCMGFDARTMLPPYMPVQRGEDVILGAVLKVCFPAAYSGYLPYVIQHDPPAERSHATAITEATFSEPMLHTNSIIETLIFQYGASIHGRSSEQNLRLLGEQLSSLGTLSQKHFEEVVWPVLAQRIASRITEAERCLWEKGREAVYWANDIQRYIAAHRAWMTGQQPFVPVDLTGDESERVAVLQSLIKKLGYLLIAWPKIIRAAREVELFSDTNHK